MSERNVGVIAIIVKNREGSSKQLNDTLSQFGHIIIGRMGIPYQERDLNIITLIVDATTDEIGSLTGKVGQLSNVTVKSTLAKV